MTASSNTTLGPGDRNFPSTCWSRILGKGGPDDPDGRRALEELATHYWRPVFAYIRARWAPSRDDAKDLTQDFFVWMLEQDFIGHADPVRGRFRALVKVAVKRFLIDRERRRGRVKRGGGRRVFSLGLGEDVDVPEIEDPRGKPPEEILDASWRREVLTIAVQRLAKTLRGESRGVYFEVFRDYFLTEGVDVDYRAVAARHGITKSDVSNYLSYAKRRYRETLRAVVADTVKGPHELREELEWFFGRLDL